MPVELRRIDPAKRAVLKRAETRPLGKASLKNFPISPMTHSDHINLPHEQISL